MEMMFYAIRDVASPLYTNPDSISHFSKLHLPYPQRHHHHHHQLHRIVLFAHPPPPSSSSSMLTPVNTLSCRIVREGLMKCSLIQPFTPTTSRNSSFFFTSAGKSSHPLVPTITAIHSLPIQFIRRIAELRFEKPPNGENKYGDGHEDEKAIARVSVDAADPEVIWEQRQKDVEAEQRRAALTSPGFSFSAAGLLFPYHLGVCECLLQKGYITENTPLAGSSAGAIVCAVLAGGATMHDGLLVTKELAHDCRENGTAFRLGAVLRSILEGFLPADIHIKASGRVRVAVTQVFRSPRGLLIDQFDSKDDLINALITSSFIPGYLAPRPATLFRNRICVDGGITQFMPPTAAPLTVRVCAFSMSRLGYKGFGISPDCNPEDRATTGQLLSWALEPAEDSVLDQLFLLGYKDAEVWANMHSLDELRSQPQQNDDSSELILQGQKQQYF